MLSFVTSLLLEFSCILSFISFHFISVHLILVQFSSVQLVSFHFLSFHFMSFHFSLCYFFPSFLHSFVHSFLPSFHPSIHPSIHLSFHSFIHSVSQPASQSVSQSSTHYIFLLLRNSSHKLSISQRIPIGPLPIVTSYFRNFRPGAGRALRKGFQLDSVQVWYTFPNSYVVPHFEHFPRVHLEVHVAPLPYLTRHEQKTL